MITVLCVRFGDRYSREYVEKLRNMVSRHLTVPYEFVCLTDDPEPIDGVRLIVQRNAGYTKGWWHKVHMFDPSLPIEGRILYFDLDIVIINNIDKLINNLDSNFYGILDFTRTVRPNHRSLNSSVMSWIHGRESKVWHNFQMFSKSALRLHGDQDWIWHLCRNDIKFWPTNLIQSYKWEIRNRNELTSVLGKKSFKFVKDTVEIDPECCVLVFHGDPKPDAIQDSIVVDNWQ
jgi:hypothetical protein